MPFTFECGVCHAVYRLDEHQITAGGVKITCPKCLNYFFLKRGGVESTETPVVEYVVPDGAYDVSSKVAEKPKEKPKEKTKPTAHKLPASVKNYFEEPTDNTQITMADLSDLPPDPPPTTQTDHYIMLGSAIIIVAATLLYLNFSGIITIPGLQKLRKKEEISQELPAPGPTERKTPKYGFPQVNPGYDPWAHQPAQGPVTQITPAQ